MDPKEETMGGNERNIAVKTLSISELFACVAKYLDLKEMVALSISCKNWSRMLTNEDFWKMMCREDKDRNLDCSHFGSGANVLQNRFKIHQNMKLGDYKGLLFRRYELSNGGLTATMTNNGLQNRSCVLGNVGMWTGKHYWEVHIDKFDPMDQPYVLIGVVPSNGSVDNWIGWPGNGCCITSIGTFLSEEVGKRFASSFGEGDTIGVYLDLDSSFIRFFLNGVDLGFFAEFKSNASVKWEDPVYPAIAVPDVGNSFTVDFHAKCPALIESPKELPYGRNG
eukprot:TRINITY_DN5459_c0_g1_i1.p1 TRINITY_DN5459_c0_g1~~TRINITY_DN5459_c0_g1_i1.p1  ORF type:complete len:298 (+),score=74.33 TRINITY_DN5459_c0_g1_i1:57-896(+)